MNNRLLIGIAITALLISGVALWFLTSPTQPAAPTAAAAPGPSTSSKTATFPPPTPTPQTTPIQPEPSQAAPAIYPAPVRPVAPAMAQWEMRIDQALRASGTESETAQILINLLPGFPPEGQADAAQHISNLILDQDYSRVLPLLRNPGLPEEVLDVFITDLMNRDDAIKLPALLDVAKIPNHPHREEAQTDLQIFLDEDFGTDWAKWDTAMKAYLKQQATEASEDAAAEGKAAAR